MTLRLSGKCGLFVVSVFLFSLSSANPTFAHDEVVYFAPQVGTVFNAKLTGIGGVGGSYEPGTTASDLDMKNSLMSGAKLGIYPKGRFLALETEVYRTTPDVKRQLQTFHEPSFGPYVDNQAYDVSVTTWAFNVLGRWPVTDRLVLIAGLGPAYYWGRIQDTIGTPRGGTQKSGKVGLNTQAGFNYYITKNWGINGEWKYNHVRFAFPEDPNEQIGRAHV
jgi:opacity protein-like surface antigen